MKNQPLRLGAEKALQLLLAVTLAFLSAPASAGRSDFEGCGGPGNEANLPKVTVEGKVTAFQEVCYSEPQDCGPTECSKTCRVGAKFKIDLQPPAHHSCTAPDHFFLRSHQSSDRQIAQAAKNDGSTVAVEYVFSPTGTSTSAGYCMVCNIKATKLTYKPNPEDDLDKNGIRDDVDAHIAGTNATATEREFMRRDARAAFGMLNNRFTPTEVATYARQMDSAVRCMNFYLHTDLMAQVLRTTALLKDWQAALDNIPDRDVLIGVAVPNCQ